MGDDDDDGGGDDALNTPSFFRSFFFATRALQRRAPMHALHLHNEFDDLVATICLTISQDARITGRRHQERCLHTPPAPYFRTIGPP